MSVWNSIDELLSDDHDDERLISSQDTLDQNELLGIDDDEDYGLFLANESKQSNQIEDENDKKSLDLTIAKKNDEICFKQEIKDIFVEPEAPKTIKKRKSDIKTEETQPSIDEIPSKKIAKIEPAENLCNDSEYLKKIEEQKRRRDEFLKEKEKKRKESKKIQISIEKETKTEAKVIKDDKKDKLNALLDTYLEEINKNEIKDLPKTFSKHIDKKYQPKTQQLKPLTYYEKLTPTNSSIYQPINIPQSAPIYEQVPLIYAPQTSLSPNTFIINPTLNIVPSIMMPPLLSNPPEPRFNFSQSLNKIPMIERNQIIRNLRPNIPQAFNSNNGSPGIGIHNIIQIKPIEIYPKAILYNLSLSTTEKRLVDLCNSINLKEKIVKINMDVASNRAEILFKDRQSADKFFKQYNRTLLELSMIHIQVV